ncbi:hypothetical protein PHYBOEH_009038 [Phytophthora boehmeriae]|uniref:Uncharacterized protein n=1 Tax=Phytophthora boehmeriae TaxID=109152 RepID=A0A8T1X5P1_9STRA|nr:hypothetical protein PHYBOEH_009038 [Phytophthora boehmeriae]
MKYLRTVHYDLCMSIHPTQLMMARIKIDVQCPRPTGCRDSRRAHFCFLPTVRSSVPSDLQRLGGIEMSTTILQLTVALAALLVLFVQADGTQGQLVQMAKWPSLRLHFTLKRSSMQVHGQSKFSMIANPTVSSDSTSVLYDTLATFDEDATTYSYSLVNGLAYEARSSQDDSTATQSVSCLDSDSLPPVNSIVSALNDAVAISNVSTSTMQCSSGNLFKVSVDGFDFIVCYSGSLGFTMTGSDMDITVEYLIEPVEILMPKVIDDTAHECAPVASSSSISSVGKALLTGGPIPKETARKLKAAFEFSDLLPKDETSCSCKSTPRPCIFVHGLGVPTEEPDNIEDLSLFPRANYWGNLTDENMPCCTSKKYAVLNTVNNSWTDDEQQQKVCDRLMSVSANSQGQAIADTIVITHSMGGLLVAGALATGKCSFAETVTWVSLASPLKGSMGSDYFQKSCKNGTNVIVENLVTKSGYCPADEGIKSLAYEGESYSTVELNEAYRAAQKVYREKVYALLCSNSFSGLKSDRQLYYWAFGVTIPHKSLENDGMVEFVSCAGGFPASKFGDTYEDRFYVTELNHGDASFRNGDAILNKAKMPVKWFECLL